MRRHAAAMGILVAVVWAMVAAGAFAQETYPNKPVRLLTGYAPGGPADLIARTLAQHLTSALGQSFVVENRSGANGSIADGVVARAAPDGYTLLVQGTAIAMNPALVANLSFDPVKDLLPVALVGDTQYLIVVHPSVPANTLREFIALAKGRAKEPLMYGAPSSPSILATTMFKNLAHIDMVRVPYRGAGLAIPGLLAGEVQMMISSIGPLLPLVEAKKVRALAVSGPKRTSLAPDLPTAVESGLPGFTATTWYGLFAPAGTPQPIVDRLNGEVNKILAQPDVQKRFFAQGFELTPATTAEFTEFMRVETIKWINLVKEAGLSQSQ